MGAYKFALRSSYGFTAWVSNNGADCSTFYKKGTTTAPALTSPGGLTGVFGGGQVIDVSYSGNNIRGMSYRGLQNIGPSNPGLSVLARIVPKWTGAPSFQNCIFAVGGFCAASLSTIEMLIDTGGNIGLNYFTASGQYVVAGSVGPASFTTNVATDLQFSWDGSTGSNKMVISQDGVVLGSINVPANFGVADGQFDYLQAEDVYIGTSFNVAGANYYLNEFAIADYAVPTTYATRTDYLPLANFNSTLSIDPGQGNVKNGTTYTIAGVAKTGTLVSTDPGQSNVKNGVSYTIESVSKTGSLISTDPGQGNVKNGVSYTIENSAKTGTLVSTDPGQSNVKNGVSYTIESVSKTGSLVSTDPGQSNVKNGTSYEIENVLKTGTLVSTDPGQTNVKNGVNYTIENSAKTGSLVSTDPGQSNVRNGVSYEIENVSLTGSLVSTDPGISNVTAGVDYEINNVPLTGTRQLVNNILNTAILSEETKSKIVFTQGDSCVLSLLAKDQDGNPVNLSGGVFTTQIKGGNGVIVSFPNSQHTANPDQITHTGEFTLTLSEDDTLLCSEGEGKDIITKVVQGPSTTHFPGIGILTVQLPYPVQ